MPRLERNSPLPRQIKLEHLIAVLVVPGVVHSVPLGADAQHVVTLGPSQLTRGDGMETSPISVGNMAQIAPFEFV